MQKLPPTIHDSWHQHLQPLFDDVKMIKIKDEILPKARYYPERHQIFKVFEMPLDQIKVVVLGQDPYPNGEAIGLAFAISPAYKIPASLRIIKAEVDKSESKYFGEKESDLMWRTLQHWTNQGVFLLNTALTVEVKNAGSHINYWQWFTREVIKIISLNTMCVWMLWGAKAQAFQAFIDHHVVMDEDNVTVISPNNGVLLAPHPAAETYSGGSGKTFTGCNHFNLCNVILQSQGKDIIKW